MPITVDIDKHPRIKLKARHTLDGKLMVLDHEDIDIVLNLESKKCICFPKENLSDRTYLAQDRMFKFLSKRGVIDHSSIRGGNVHGSLEGTMLESKIPGVDQAQACLFAISQFLNDEKPFFKTSKDFDASRLDSLIDPSEEESTEFGEVPQSDRKGSMHPGIRPYGFQYNYSLIREAQKKKEKTVQ